MDKFATEKFDVKLSSEEIQTGLLSFFKTNDLDLLFASSSESLLPSVKESKKIKYIIAKYFTELQSTDPQVFQMAVSLAKGHAIASLITYEELNSYSGDLDKVEIYLDAPIIFNLLGLNGDSNLKLSRELLDSLKKLDSKMRIFDVNYNEVVKSIEEAIDRLTTKSFDISRASRILRTAVRENITPSQLRVKLNQLDSLLVENEILREQSPTLHKQDWKYQISETKLQSFIEDLYAKDEGQKVPYYKAIQIQRDVESISNIFKIRRDNRAISLKNCKAILLTSNDSISYAARKFEKAEWPFKSAIPVCITDVFLSAILWANYPNKNENLNIKRLISECYSIIELDNRLLSRFVEDVKKLNSEKAITEEQFYLLSANNLAYNLLESKTFNDIDEYTDKTPREILEDLELRMNANLSHEKNRHLSVEKNVRGVSRKIAKYSFLFIAAALIIVAIVLKLSGSLPSKGFGSWCINILVAFFAIFGFLRWMEVVPPKTIIEAKIEGFIFKKVSKFLYKES
ncbi:hypothetical protein ACQ86N_16885 [Puia sp. P3]|uniref:hypothetical protein n=1 Tax=Puia sp. P3 TaxID=3423952 RepID=UPI003D669AC1